ncbi:unnamed protein product [Rotaria socialis]|uniref:AB hydrolase-1 domain-containing protein n=1 Tax=Rotaria socialis TaxID=392032 RepID=A0A820RYC7_9BILA|nr:unnamed protein product [Rotaria socialis]CAF4444336.1 unnamed protein product [Rotaria socialis]
MPSIASDPAQHNSNTKMCCVIIMLFYLLAIATGDGSTPPRTGQHANIGNIQVWYDIYEPEHGTPILFLHGDFTNGDYWGFQIEDLKSSYKCIVMDSRGQGRSTSSAASITYHLMMTDVVGTLDYLGINRVHIVGWSGGAIVGFNLAINYPNKVISLFAFAANYIISGVKEIGSFAVFNEHLTHTEIEYGQLNSVPNY